MYRLADRIPNQCPEVNAWCENATLNWCCQLLHVLVAYMRGFRNPHLQCVSWLNILCLRSELVPVGLRSSGPLRDAPNNKQINCAVIPSSHGDAVNAHGNGMIDSELLANLACSSTLVENPAFSTNVVISSQQSHPSDRSSRGVL